MKRVLTVQDLSCLGKCSLTVALPVLSAMGCSTAVLPTAVLSTHTAFPDPHVRDLTGDMEPIMQHWQSIGAGFDAILVGYLSDPAQVRAVDTLWDSFDAIRILDPVMGDHGKLYSRITSDHVDAIRQLCKKADLLIPNVTEACLLTGTPYAEAFSLNEYMTLVSDLQALGAKAVILTGVSIIKENTGFLSSDGILYQATALPGSYHGTGDLFAAVCTGALMQECSLSDAAEKAADFVAQTIAATPVGTGVPDGPNTSPFGLSFEPLLSHLTNL